MFKKRGIEIQFNWIFVLFAGAAIILFFTVVIAKQRSASETSARAEILRGLDAIITAASVSTDTTDIVPIPKSSIELSCGRISISGVSTQFQNLIVFYPDIIKGTKLVWQALPFSIPHRATNFLYISSPDIRYILIGDGGLLKEVNKSMSSFLNRNSYKPDKINEIKNQNNHKVKFIFFGSVNHNVLMEFKKMPDKDVSAVNIVGDAEKGRIEFYKKDGSSWSPEESSFYLKIPSIIGAIYSENKEIYECNMRNAFSKLALVTDIHKGRAAKLKTENPPSKTECRNSYQTAIDNFQIISSKSSIIANSQDLNNNQADFYDIEGEENKLLVENSNLQKHSCPLIY